MSLIQSLTYCLKQLPSVGKRFPFDPPVSPCLPPSPPVLLPLSILSQNVTKCHKVSQSVTTCHNVSQRLPPPSARVTRFGAKDPSNRHSTLNATTRSCRSLYIILLLHRIVGDSHFVHQREGVYCTSTRTQQPKLCEYNIRCVYQYCSGTRSDDVRIDCSCISLMLLSMCLFLFPECCCRWLMLLLLYFLNAPVVNVFVVVSWMLNAVVDDWCWCCVFAELLLIVLGVVVFPECCCG